MLKTEALVGAIALGVSVVTGVTTTAIHWGVESNQIAQMEKNQVTISTKLDEHQQELASERAHNAAVEQKLDDMIDRLDKIQRNTQRLK